MKWYDILVAVGFVAAAAYIIDAPWREGGWAEVDRFWAPEGTSGGPECAGGILYFADPSASGFAMTQPEGRPTGRWEPPHSGSLTVGLDGWFYLQDGARIHVYNGRRQYVRTITPDVPAGTNLGAVSEAGELLMSAVGRTVRVVHLSPNGRRVGRLNLGTTGFSSAGMIAAGKGSLLFVGGPGEIGIYSLEDSRRRLGSRETSIEGEQYRPELLAAAPGGRLFASCQPRRVFVYTPDGSFEGYWRAPRRVRIVHLTADDGRCYVTEKVRDRLRIRVIEPVEPGRYP